MEREFETASRTVSVFFPHLEERPRGSSSLGERLMTQFLVSDSGRGCVTRASVAFGDSKQNNFLKAVVIRVLEGKGLSHCY